LLCIILLTILSVVLDTDLKTVGDLGELPKTLPIFLIPSIPITLETFLIIFPYSSAIALVGLLESLMTATIVDDLTNTTSNKNKECIGQGIANCATGFLGGMAGCAMIGQSIINIKSGGRGRLSSLCAGIFLLVMCVSLSDLVQLIPMAALVAVMIMVSVSTFDWQSIKSIRRNPKSSSVVMLATVVTVVFSHNLAIGVLVGVLLSSLFLASKIAKTFKISSELSIDKKNRVYLVHGQVFFASASHFVNEFDFSETVEKIIIDVSNAHIWDVTSVAALETVTTRFQEKGTLIQIIGINHASKKIIHKYNGSKMNHMLISFQELQNS
jgi:SulP family sulfate permease